MQVPASEHRSVSNSIFHHLRPGRLFFRRDPSTEPPGSFFKRTGEADWFRGFRVSNFLGFYPVLGSYFALSSDFQSSPISPTTSQLLRGNHNS